jgi:hypothetical protein
MDWIDRASRDLWKHTHGTINKHTMDDLTRFVLAKYHSQDSHAKDLGFAKAFLKYLAKIHLDTRYYAFELFRERPRSIRERKSVTSRIITKADIEKILRYIEQSKKAGLISEHRAAHYRAFVLFGAYTGQRPIATISRLTVGQFREALRSSKSCLHVRPAQDKIKMEHWVPLHPLVADSDSIKALLNGRDNNELFFEYNSLSMWLKRRRIPLERIKAYFNLSDLRKWTEQHGDVIQWDQSNRAYVLTHGVSGVDWKHYKHPLPEIVYDVYMKSWRDVDL